MFVVRGSTEEGEATVLESEGGALRDWKRVKNVLSRWDGTVSRLDGAVGEP